jgi:CheY-like chemotaxis protein
MKKVEIACIIDDDQIYVFGVKKLIALHNFCKNILVFGNGEEALNYMTPLIESAEKMPDVILLDINMPVMDGWEFLDEFIKIQPRAHKTIEVYMVSSSINPADVERAKKYSELSSYLIKPITPEDLKRVFTDAA